MVRIRTRLATAALVLFVPLLLASGCGSTKSSSPDESPSTPTSAPPASVLPGATTVPGGGPNASVCGPLSNALRIADLQPKDAGSWALERQRILTDAATNTALYDAATGGAPADVAAQLVKLAAYSKFVGTAVQSASDFGSAVNAIATYPDIVGASMAMAAVDTWRRANCPS